MPQDAPVTTTVRRGAGGGGGGKGAPAGGRWAGRPGDDNGAAGGGGWGGGHGDSRSAKLTGRSRQRTFPHRWSAFPYSAPTQPGAPQRQASRPSWWLSP